MNLYEQYMKERGGYTVLWDAAGEGFLTFKVNGPECFIHDIFVSESVRRKHVGKKMVMDLEVVAAREGCTFITGNVWLLAKNATEVLKAALAVGFSVTSAQNNGITVEKKVEVLNG